MRKAMLMRFALPLVLLAALLAPVAQGALLQVSDAPDAACDDGACDLPSALAFAAGNLEDDTLELGPGVYAISAPLEYRPAQENHTLAIIGSGSDASRLEAAFEQALLRLDTTLLPDDSPASITLEGIDLYNANHDQGERELSITTNQADIFFGDVSISSPRANALFSTQSGSITCSGDVNVSGAAEFESNMDAGGEPETGGGSVVGPGPGAIVNPGGSLVVGSLSFGSLEMEGRTIDLLAGGGLAALAPGESCLWTQLQGPAAAISSTTAPGPTLVAPSVDAQGNEIVFRCTVSNEDGIVRTETHTCTIADNGIEGFPADSTPFEAATGRDMAIKVSGGALVRLDPLDPDTLQPMPNRPANLPFGLVNFSVKPDQPGGSARVTVYLDEAAPAGCGWFKYSPDHGWTDFSAYAQFSPDRRSVELFLVDGGPGDDDGLANGVIKDPSGPGFGESLSAESGGASSGSSGSCFIDAVFAGKP